MKNALLTLCIAWFSLAGGSSPVWAQEPDPDEDRLREEGIGTDNASLVAYLRSAAAREGDLLRLEALIRQLGSASFKERTRASKRIVAIGYSALEGLRQGEKSADKEIARGARDCMEQISTQKQTGGIAASVARLIVRRKPSGAVQALLTYVPYVDDEICEEEIWYALDTLCARCQTGHPPLVAALQDPLPGRRAVAGCIIGYLGTPDEKASARNLLGDPIPLVRLRTSQGLLAGGDKHAIPTLIDLLDNAPIGIAWQAEELLRCIPEVRPPDALIRAGSADERRTCRAAWKQWWRRVASSLNLNGTSHAFHRPGLLLVCDGLPEGADGGGRVWLCGQDGRPRWGLKDLSGLVDAHLLSQGTVLLAEAEAQRISERDVNGTILWQATDVPRSVLRCGRHVNGNTWMAGTGGFVREVTRAHEEVYARELSIDRGNVEIAHIAPDGRVTCVVATGSRTLLCEADTRTGRLLRRTAVTGFFGSLGQLEALGHGHVLLVSSSGVTEIDSKGEGKRVICALLTKTSCAHRLHNGNTLIAGGTDPAMILEIEPGGKIVWEIPLGTVPIRIRDCFPLLRLGFHRRVAPECDLNSVAHRADQLRDLNPAIRRWALTALRAMGPGAEAAIPSLVARVNASGTEAPTVFDVLGQIGPKGVCQIAGFLRDPRSEVRAEAAIALAMLRGGLAEPYIKDLIRALRDEHRQVRIGALGALGSLQAEAAEAVLPISALLEDRDRIVSFEALRALENIGPKAGAAVPTLIRLVEGTDSDLRIGAAKALSKIGPAAGGAVPALLGNLTENADPRLTVAVCEALGSIRSCARAAVPRLVDILGSKDALLRGSAARALGRLGPDAKSAVPALIRALERGPESVSEEAADALGKIGPSASAAIPALVRLQQRTDRTNQDELNWAARRAIRRIVSER
jgi:HEAT repeat protein